MTVKDLKELLNEVDENLTVMFSSTGEFHIPSKEDSGVITFGDACDKEGNEIEDTFTEEEMTFFVLVTSNLAGLSVEELQKL